MSQAQSLVDRLDQMDSLIIVCHDNPDPDAIASAVGLKRIATDSGVSEIDIVYGGEISHQENRSFVNLLNFELIQHPETNPSEYQHLALVDQSTPGSNNQLPPETDVDIVIDHHSTEDAVAEFVDLREDYSSTSVILTEYLRDLDIEPDQELATGLLFALRTETHDFLKNTTVREHEAATFLQPLVDMDRVRTLDESPFSEQTLDAIGTAIQTREVQSTYLVAHVGWTGERDALPQAADYLLNLEGVETVLVFGILDDKVEMSARSTDSRVDIGSVLKDVFSDVGSAGGHEDRAAAQLSLGLCADATGEESLLEMVTQIIKQRYFEAAGYKDEEFDDHE